MLINKNIESERRLTLAISGSIDTNSAPQLREAVAAVPADTERLTLDFRDVYVITSAGLRELLVCAQRFPEDRLRLINVSPDIMEVFSITGFDDILNAAGASRQAVGRQGGAEKRARGLHLGGHRQGLPDHRG